MATRAAGLLIFRRLSGQIQYLLLQASDGDYHWSPPKGHVDPGEDDFTTALRETFEEVGYAEEDLKIFKDMSKPLEYEVMKKPKVVIYWLAELIEANKLPKLSNEHDDFKWLAKNDAKIIGKYKDLADLIEYFDEKIHLLPN